VCVCACAWACVGAWVRVCVCVCVCVRERERDKVLSTDARWQTAGRDKRKKEIIPLTFDGLLLLEVKNNHVLQTRYNWGGRNDYIF
jgi:hypothetical protein